MRASLRLFTLITLFALSVSGVWATEPQGADIEFSSSVIDLGIIAQDGGKQIVRINYTNTGDLPLVVTEVRTSCSCMTISYERKKIVPSERATMIVTLDPQKAPKGQYYRVMQIFSTAKSGVKRLTVKAVIE